MEIHMGIESFQVMLRGGPATWTKAHDAIRQLQQIAVDREALATKESSYFVMNDGRHVIEIELMQSPLEISCRFTLCHPPSVDKAFLEVVRLLVDSLRMEVVICDDVQLEHAHPYSLSQFQEFAKVAAGCMETRRLEWIEMFGPKQMPASTRQVFSDIIVPQCRGVEKAQSSSR